LCDEFGFDGEFEVVSPSFEILGPVFGRVVAESVEVVCGGVSVAS